MIIIEDLARSVFPDLAVQALRVDGLVDAAERVDMQELEERVQAAVTARDPVHSVWRSAYQRMGLKPSKFPSSVEALSRRAAKAAQGWKTGQPAIDVYNAMSIIHGAPIGCYDAAALVGQDILVRPVDRDHDRFTPVGGSVDMSKGNQDLLVYAAGAEVLCWALNYRDSEHFCLRPGTQSAYVMSESISPEQHEMSRAAISEFAALLAEKGATIVSLDTSNRIAMARTEEYGVQP